MPGPARANVLIVDDEPQSLAAMKQLLEGPDRNVVAVGSGADALRAVLTTEYALIVLDIRMPGISGFETAAVLRKRRQSRHTPIIFLTAAFDDVESVARGYRAGAVDYLMKPIDPDILRAKVAIFVELYEKKAALAAEVAQRQKAEAALARANVNLESKIRERAASVLAVNEQLRCEIETRRRIEEDLRAATLAAEQANVAKSSFLANMSHEIRTPLSAIIGMTEVALTTELTAEQRQYLDLAKAASESLLTVINDILDFSKIEAGRLEMEAIAFSLRESLSGTMKTLAVQAHEKGLELACEIAPDTPDALIGDPIRLRQIVSNLVGNAIKFTEDGEVVIRVRPEHLYRSASNGSDGNGDGNGNGGNVNGGNGNGDSGVVTCHFSVTDTGIGISAEKQGEIFAPFAQADSSTTRIYGGTGLGLAIAVRLVEMMGGRIWVASEPNKGSTFHFTIRVGVQTGPEILGDTFDFSSVRALVVEDHFAHRQVLVNMLRRWNVDVQEAASGEQALLLVQRAARDLRPLQVVLLDESLPDVDSVGLANAILQVQVAAAPVILLLTSSPHRTRNATGGLASALRRLAKPITQAELLDAIEDATGMAIDRAPPVAPPPQSPLTVLLVEDNAVNRRLAEIMLAREGHRVVAVDNGQAALDALDDSHFDVILMDLQMPKMDGIETTHAIRERERASGGHVPIIALTAHAMAGDRERCLAAGMDGYLTKPVQAAMLLKAIGRPTATRRARPARASSKAVLDRAALVERVDGDPQLLDEIIELYFANYPRLMGEAREAMAKGDTPRFSDSLHTLSGMFSNIAATAVQDLTHLLQTLDLARERDRAEMIWVMLDQEVQALNAELSNLVYERAATRTGVA